MIHVVMDNSWTHQYELLFSVLRKQTVTPCTDVHACRAVFRHTSLLSAASVEKQGRILAMGTPSVQILASPARRTTDSWRDG